MSLGISKLEILFQMILEAFLIGIVAVSLSFLAAPIAAKTAAEYLVVQQEQQAQLRKKQNELKKVESRIEELEDRDKEIDAELEKKEIFTNVAEVTKLSKEKDAIQTKLEELYEKWEELSE